MKKILRLNILLLAMLCSCSMAIAQERVVSGRVTSSEDGSALPGVNIVQKGTANGTVTDANGAYTISVPSSGGTLSFPLLDSNHYLLILEIGQLLMSN